MSNGSGRGRGWLNLARASDSSRSLGLAKPLPNNDSVPQSPKISEEFRELINRINELHCNDDGILFNKKMQHIQNFWLNECQSKEEVERSFDEVYNACLFDVELASKLVSLIASRTFVSQELHDCNFRQQFLKHLQQDFESSNQLHTGNAVAFRNCVHMIGEFYNRARLATGEPFEILAVPLLSCLELLLSSKMLPDLKLFTTQLYINGSTLKNLQPEELGKLGIKLRQLLVSEGQLVKEAKLWLLLALDLFNVRFAVLPGEIYKFYEEQLGSSVMISFQRPHDVLSIQTLHSSKILDSYQSNVNVLQISTSPSENSSNDPHSTAEYNGTYSNDVPKNSEKPGRPILGVGARFIKNKSEESTSWNNKNSSSVRSNRKPPIIKNNKGWEHDDRFENDYN